MCIGGKYQVYTLPEELGDRQAIQVLIFGPIAEASPVEDRTGFNYHFADAHQIPIVEKKCSVLDKADAVGVWIFGDFDRVVISEWHDSVG